MLHGSKFRMSHLKRLGNQISIPIKRDDQGFLGRECPACESYFKITPGTGITDSNQPCNCPYCGHKAGQDHFWTRDQIEYAKSVALRKVDEAVHRDLKSLEFNIKPKGPFGIGVSMKVKKGRPLPIKPYLESQLETEVVCDHCTLRYAIYGVFAFCPDCGLHNSRQILEKNLELAQKQVRLASQVDKDLAEQLIADALENGVSAFDGFGRETCRVFAAKSADPAKSEKLSFQNLTGARNNLQTLFGFDLAAALAAHQWTEACRGFQKRHLLAHKMGIVDAAYVSATNDAQAIVGRKVAIDAAEVTALLDLIKKLGTNLSTALQNHP